jgi:hypothetical protein
MDESALPNVHSPPTPLKFNVTLLSKTPFVVTVLPVVVERNLIPVLLEPVEIEKLAAGKIRLP